MHSLNNSIIRFRLNKKLIEEFPDEDLEYTACISLINTQVTWLERGEERSLYYPTSDVVKYFDNKTWVEV